MVSQADRELIRNFVTELRPYMESVDNGVEEFAQPIHDGVIVGQAVQALGMIRGAGQVLMVEDLVTIAGWLAEAFQIIQENPDLAPEEAVRRLTALTNTMRECLAALDAGEDTAEIVHRARVQYESIPSFEGPRPGSGQLQAPSDLDALFGDDDSAFSAPTMPLTPAAATGESAPSTEPPAVRTDEGKTPVFAGQSHSQPTDEIPKIDPELREIFLEEASQLVVSFGELARQIARQPDDTNLIDALRRDAHTLKGAANMTGFPMVGRVGRAIEHLLDAHCDHDVPITRDSLELLLVTWKMLRAMIQRLDDLSYFESPINSVVNRAEQLREIVIAAASQRKAAGTSTTVISEQPAVQRTREDAPTDELISISTTGTDNLTEDGREAPVDPAEDAGGDQVVEVSGEAHVEPADSPAPDVGEPDQTSPTTVEPTFDEHITVETPRPDFSEVETFSSPVVKETEETAAYAEVEEEKPQTESFWEPDTDELLKQAAQENGLHPPQAKSAPESASEELWSEGTAPGIDIEYETFEETDPAAGDPFFDPIAESEVDIPEPIGVVEDNAAWFMTPAADDSPDIDDEDEPPQTEPFWSGDAVEDPDAISNQIPEDEPITFDPFFEPVEDSRRPPLFEDYLPSDESFDESTAFGITESPFDEDQVDDGEPVHAEQPETRSAVSDDAQSLVAGLMAGARADAGEIADRHPAAPESRAQPETPVAGEEPAATDTGGEIVMDELDQAAAGPGLSREDDQAVTAEAEIVDEIAGLDNGGVPDWFEEPEGSDILTSELVEPGSSATAGVDVETPAPPRRGEISIERFLGESGSAALSAALLDMAFTASEAAESESESEAGQDRSDVSVFDEGSEAALAAEMFETFRLESIDYLEVLNRAAMQIDRDPEAAGPIADIRRALHTLKGAAAAAEVDPVVDRAHVLEDFLERLDDAGEIERGTVVNELLAAVEDIEGLIEEHRRGLISAGDTQDGATPGGDSTLRVSVARIDNLLNTVGELVVNRAGFEQRLERLASSLEDLSHTAGRLQRSSSLLEREAYSGDTLGRIMRGDLPGLSVPMVIGGRLGDWDELEMERYTEFDRMIRQLAEVGADISAAVGEITALRGDLDTVATRQRRLTSTLQDELMDIRMVPISSIAPRLYRLVRRTAASRGKDVRLVLEGGETPFDKLLLDALSESLLHLLRNAVDHGIEGPTERSKAGKPASGTVRVRAYRDGSEAVIDIIDDGAGIDHERIAERARELGIDIPNRMSRQDALALIFRSGFSTREEADELSGRGVGLDVVEQTVGRYKGRVTVDSIPGRGTIISLRLPVMLSVIQAFLVTAGGTQFAIPIASIEFVADRTDQPLTQIGNSVVVETANAIIPVIDLSARYGQAATPIMQRESGWVMVAEVAGQRWALAVDELHAQQEIVVKPLGRYLRHLPGLMGATILGNGEVALIIDVPQILGVDAGAGLAGSIDQEVPAGDQVAGNGAGVSPPRDDHRRTALVVDDSLSVRRVVGHTLERYDWDVTLARDGVEALELLESGTVDVVITDIEMPRMDGFELLSAIRGRSELAGLAVIILTSRSGEKHRTRALELGADDYLVKPFQEQKLLEVVGRASGAAVAAL